MAYYPRRYKKRKSQFSSYQQPSMQKILCISKEYPTIGCWRFERSYQPLDGKFVYSDFASGEGPITRHLCGDNRCINGLHLVKGTDIQNAEDEIDVRNFVLKYLSDRLNEDYSQYPNDLAGLIVLPRARRILYNKRFKTMSELALHVRNKYRIDYVKKLIRTFDNGDLPDSLRDRYERAERQLQAISRRNDIAIAYIPGGF